MAYLRSVLMPFLFKLQFTGFSVLWMLISLMLGLIYAFVLYRKQTSLSPAISWSLFAARTLSVAFIAFLLFAPFIKLISRTVEKPLIIVLQDNSASLAFSKPSGFSLQEYSVQMDKFRSAVAPAYELRDFTFGSAVLEGHESRFDDKATDINAAFKFINDRFSNRNIGAVILATDGIYTRGGNPQYEALKSKAPVYTIAMGDTIPKKDLLVANVNYNNIVYLDNDFQVEVSVDAYQSKGLSSKLTVSDKSGIVFSQSLNVPSGEFHTVIPITLKAKQKGIQRFTAKISAVPGELSEENNIQTFFVEVIDGRQKVFILANSPHPDIAAIKQSIENNKNYEVKTAFVSLFKPEDIERSDLLILHQLPSAGFPAQNLLPLIRNKNSWFILGSQTDIGVFSSVQPVLNVGSAGYSQEVTARFNTGFYDFVLAEATRNKIINFAPLIAPFGNYSLKGQASVLLEQQIGRVETERPLLLFSKDAEYKTAILAGEGIWRWRLEDFRENGNHEATDELVSKVIQAVSNKEDRRKFRVYPARSAFDESEQVVLNAELYNEAYELVNGPDVSVTLKDGKNKVYPFLFSKTGNSYILNAGILPPGEYSFVANTALGKDKYSAKGNFVINSRMAEFRRTTADHQLLYSLARQSGGEMISPAEISSLFSRIEKNELVKTVSYEDTQFREMIDIKWLFFIILALLGLEWFSRKRSGEL